jgi:hypothetical protein
LAYQSGNSRQGKPCLPNNILFKVDRIIAGRSEIGLAQVRAAENGIRQVAVVKGRACQVRFGEVRSSDRAFFEFRLFQSVLDETGIVQTAFFKAHFEEEREAMSEVDPHYLAMQKGYIVQPGIADLRIAQVAVDELTVGKAAAG